MKLRKILIAALGSIFIMTGLFPTYAIGDYDVFEPNPVVIEGSHHVKNNETLRDGRHTFVLTAKDGAPMPEGSSGGVKKVVINSNEIFSFGEINYKKQGTYEYTVSREITKSDRLKQDDSVYKCKVAVFSDGNAVVVFEKIGTSGKPNKIEYTDEYIPEKSGNVKTGDSQQLLLYGGILAAAVIAVILLARKKDRQ